MKLLTILLFLALAAASVLTYDPSPLQDFCVAVNSSKEAVFVNGKYCKDPKLAYADDFTFTGFRTPGNTSNPLGLKAGFVTSNQLGNRLFTKVLYPGDMFVFPIGLIHFQFNIGKTNAVAFAGLSSQNPGVVTIANSVFGSQPTISSDVLTKAFQVDKDVVKYLQSQFWWDN